MSAWGANSFQNDWALDWIGDLIESHDHSLVRIALLQALRYDGRKCKYFLWICVRKWQEVLPVSLAAESLAAAEIVAARFGHPPARLPNGVQEWLESIGESLEGDLISISLDAIGKICESSELKNFREEGDMAHAEEWYRVIDDLKQRLNKCNEENVL